MQHEMQMGFRALSSSLSSQLQPLLQLAPALQQITTQWDPLVQHVAKQDEALKKQEVELGKISDNVDLINAKIEGVKDMSPGSALGDEASLYAENREEIRVSAKKIELTVNKGLEQNAAEEEIKKSIATTGKTLEDLKGKFVGADFYADDSFTKVVVAFDTVAIRKMAQAAVCANLIDGKWKGSKLKLGSGEEIRFRVQQPAYARRRDERLKNARDAVMAQKPTSDFNDFPIKWNERAISKRDGTVIMKQEQFGAWVVKDVPVS